MQYTYYTNLSQEAKNLSARNYLKSMESSKNCEFSFCFGDLNRDLTWDCLSKVELEPLNKTDKLIKLLEENKLMNEYGQRSYIPINFAFAESILIMVGLFINLLVSSVRFYDPSIILSKPLIINGTKGLWS